MLPEFIRKKLEGRRRLQQLVGNTGWMMGDQIVRQAVGLLVGVWLARYLGPQLFGDFSYAFAVVLIVSPVAMLALDAITIRRLAQDPACRNEALGTAFVLMVVAGVLALPPDHGDDPAFPPRRPADPLAGRHPRCQHDCPGFHRH